MKLPYPFSKFLQKKPEVKVIPILEQKDTTAGGYNPLLFPFFGAEGDHPILYVSEAVLYMMECAPVWTALHKIAKGVASIPCKVRDKNNGEYVEHPVLELLAKPDADITYSEFIEQASQWYLGTGNTYFRAIGLVTQPPLELRVMPSYSTTITPAGDGYAAVYLTRLLNIADTYTRKEVMEYGRRRFRFYANEMNELYHIRSYNPQVGSNMIYGLSPLNAVFYEMRQYVEAAKSNLSFLNRAVKLSGVWTYDGFLSDQQRQELERQINTAYAGSNNVGRNALLDKKVAFTDTTKNARDMDYMKTVEHTAQAIYKALDIPLPLVNAENMTYDNYESSQFYLFKDAVIPLTQRIFQELTNFLMPRYENSENLEIAFNPKDIPQLEPERNAQMKIKKDTGIYTINELRKESEAEPLDGGQYVYGTMGALPIATDDADKYASGSSAYDQEGMANYSNQQTQDQQAANEENQKNANKAAKEEFIRRLKLQVNKDGTSRFTEEDIQELAQRHYE